MNRKRRTWTPQEKSNIVLEVLRENATLAEIAKRFDIAPQLLMRWRDEFINNMPSVFDKKNDDLMKMKQEHEEEKGILVKKIGELSLDVDFLKKKQEQVLQIRKRRNA